MIARETRALPNQRPNSEFTYHPRVTPGPVRYHSLDAFRAAMMLLVRGRLSNVYWETSAGSTYEQREARVRLDEALDAPGEAQVHLSDFSRDVWKTRHEVQDSIRSRLQPRDPAATPAELLVTEETTLRNQVLEELCAQLPAVAQAFLFDLMTGWIDAKSRSGLS